MSHVTWIHVVGCAGGLACVTCADALGLHDLAEGRDAGDPASATAPSSDGGDKATGMSLIPLDARPETGSPPETNTPVSVQRDAMPETTNGDPAQAGAPVSVVSPPASPGPETPTRDAAPPLDSAVPSESDAAPSLDSAVGPREAGAEGGACGASGRTVHSNGVGQTFQDCAPSGTHNATQALEACSAFTGDSASCTIASCEDPGDRAGNVASEQAACSTGWTVCDCWTFTGANAGLVQSTNARKCRPCASGGSLWN